MAGTGSCSRVTAEPVFRRCHIAATAGHGLLVLDTAAGLLADCTIEEAGSAAVAVTGSGTPTVQGGRIAGGGEAALLFDGAVKATLTGVTVEGGESEVTISVTGGARLAVEESRVRGGRHGVMVSGGGQATIVSSDIAAATAVGVAG